MGFFDVFKKKSNELKAYVSGNVIPIEKVPDPVFAEGTMGEGVAIEPSDNVLYAPADGTITVTSEGTYHAVCMQLKNGIEVLLHIGVDTVAMKGKGFKAFVKENQFVKQGTKLIEFDIDAIKAENHATCVICAISEKGSAKNLKFFPNQQADKNQTVIATWE